MKAMAVFYLVAFIVMTIAFAFVEKPSAMAMMYGGAVSLVGQAALYFYLFARDQDSKKEQVAKKEAPAHDDFCEGRVQKGGVNRGPVGPRPPTPPGGQGGKTEAKR